VRAILKQLLETGLLHGGPAAISRASHRGRALILAYHNVVPDEEVGWGDASLHLSMSSFRAQLAVLRSAATVVPLADVLDRASALADETHDKPRVAVTFDDAYRGAVMLAVPELARHGMPATVFVSPGRLGGQSFWWDRFAGSAAASPTTPSGDFRQVALEEFAGDDDRISNWVADHGGHGARLSENLLSAEEAELDRAARLPGITLASHTWSHPNLTRLDDGALREELARPMEWLAGRDGDTRPWLAYPYGISDDRVAAAAAEVGYEAALRVAGGWLPRGSPDPFRLPRLNVPAGLSEAGFRLRLAGLLGGAA
jgi:peptidoglycan/xylan/chitin deacetylase (PgdA/CDA1 family)